MEKGQPLGKNTCQAVLYTFFISSLYIFHPAHLGGLLNMSPHDCFRFIRISLFQALNDSLVEFNSILVALPMELMKQISSGFPVASAIQI